MIKVRLYNSRKDTLDSIRESNITSNYRERDFFWLVQGSICDKEKKPPFRDEDSLRFIREIDKAELVGGEDWYSVVTPFGRTNVTALCGGTKFSLVLINKSRHGLYTAIDEEQGYGEDIWGRLADLSTDILVAFDLSKLNPSFASLPIKADYEIENFPYEGREVRAVISYQKYVRGHMEHGVYYCGNTFFEIAYRWYKDVGGIINMAERLVNEAGEYYHYPPRVFTLKNFAETLKPCDAMSFETDYQKEIELMDSCGLPQPEYDEELNKLRQSDGYKEYLFCENDLVIKNYLQNIPKEPMVKYPVNLVVTKTSDGECTIRSICSVKYPTYSEAVMGNGVLTFEFRSDEQYVLVIDAEVLWEGCDELRQVQWGFRNYGCTLELYDGIRALEEFVKEIKEAYETGNLYVEYEEWENAEQVKVRKKVEKDGD